MIRSIRTIRGCICLTTEDTEVTEKIFLGFIQCIQCSQWLFPIIHAPTPCPPRLRDGLSFEVFFPVPCCADKFPPSAAPELRTPGLTLISTYCAILILSYEWGFSNIMLYDKTCSDATARHTRAAVKKTDCLIHPGTRDAGSWAEAPHRGIGGAGLHGAPPPSPGARTPF